LNQKGLRFLRGLFFLFIPCSTVQNSPKVICRTAFVCCDRVRVPHRSSRFRVT